MTINDSVCLYMHGTYVLWCLLSVSIFLFLYYYFPVSFFTMTYFSVSSCVLKFVIEITWAENRSELKCNYFCWTEMLFSFTDKHCITFVRRMTSKVVIFCKLTNKQRKFVAARSCKHAASFYPQNLQIGDPSRS